MIEKDKETKGVDDPVEYLRQLLKSPETTEISERDPQVNKPVTTGDCNVQQQPKFIIEFVTQEKLEKNNKRRYESHMISKVTQILQNIGGCKNPYGIIGVSFTHYYFFNAITVKY